jgi:hypothetical protein
MFENNLSKLAELCEKSFCTISFESIVQLGFFVSLYVPKINKSIRGIITPTGFLDGPFLNSKNTIKISFESNNIFTSIGNRVSFAIPSINTTFFEIKNSEYEKDYYMTTFLEVNPVQKQKDQLISLVETSYDLDMVIFIFFFF